MLSIPKNLRTPLGAIEAPVDNKKLYGRRGNEYFEIPLNQTFLSNFKFSTSTSASDPSSGNFRLNNVDVVDSTLLYIDSLSSEGVDVSNILRSLRSGDAIYIQNKDNPDNFVRFHVTGDSTDNTGWFTIPIEYINGDGTTPLNTQNLSFSFNLVGGTTGGGVEQTSGTWEPTITALSGSPTVGYLNQEGYWTKTGVLIHFRLAIQWNSVSGGSGGLRITLPPTHTGTDNVPGSGASINRVSGLSFTGQMCFSIGTTHINITQMNNDGTFESVEVSDMGSSGTIYISGFYEIAEV